MSLVAVQLLERTDTAANFTAQNPVLGLGEQGFESDTLKSKHGDGVTAWNSLDYDISDADLSSLGTMSTQNANAVNIDGGSVDGTVIGAASKAEGTFTTLTCDHFAELISDRRAKVGIKPMEVGLAEILQLKPSQYRKKGGKRLELGLTAQDLQKVLPNLVTKRGDGNLGVHYLDLIALLIKGMQEQQKKIDTLIRLLVALLITTLLLCASSAFAGTMPSAEFFGTGKVISATGVGQIASVTHTYTKELSATKLYGDGSALTGITFTPNWYAITGIPAQVQAVSNGLQITMAGISVTQLSVTTNATAAQFIGGGAGLTGVTAAAMSWYGLTAIPTQVAAVSDSGNISMGLVSSTFLYANQLSATTASIGTLGVGAVAASGNITGSPLISTSAAGVVSGNYVYGRVISGTSMFTGGLTASGIVTATFFEGDGSRLTGIAAGGAPSWYTITSIPTYVQNVSNAGALFLTGLGVNGTLSATTVSTTTASATFLYGAQISGSAVGVYNLPSFESIILAPAGGTFNNYNMTFTSATQVTSLIRFAPTAMSRITGIISNGVQDGKVIRIRNGTTGAGAGRVFWLERESGFSTAANRISYPAGKLPIILMPGDEVELRYSTASSRWEYMSSNRGGISPQAIFDDFNEYSTGSCNLFTGGTTTGVACSKTSSSGIAGADQGAGSGVITTGTSANSRAYSGGSGSGDFFLGDGNALCVLRWEVDQLSTAAQTLKTWGCFGDYNNSSIPVDSVGPVYDASASTAWRFAAFSNGNSTSNTTTKTVTAGEAIKFLMHVNDDGSRAELAWAISDTWTIETAITSNIPTGSSRALGIQTGITKYAGTNHTSATIDYSGWRYDSVNR
ncbi:tail fiber domain-containing protein [Bradyrhizobium sp.]|uniref:tail fiber domain-containing protein n=1 Tax=Bradyrhizobium sp. TaxID=376 RepID=UPI002736CC29|nr:tail fiber domain-containing protein [Bradyrhizobium sp.]MDP3078693.1 tail fiber domain-containing protein [Bradyrhizobium sp.]